MTLIPVLSAPSERGALERESVSAFSPLNGSNAPRFDSLRSPTLFTCPMASHADVVADKPGKCPKCEMDLVATSTVKHGETAEEHWRKQHGGAP